MYQDLTFFYNFNSAESIIRDPLPIKKTIDGIADLLGASMNLCTNSPEAYYKQGDRKGEWKGVKISEGLAPGLSAYESTLNSATQLFSNSSHGK